MTSPRLKPETGARVIGYDKLSRIESNAVYVTATREGVKFMTYDHGALLATDGYGKQFLLFEGGEIRGSVARLVWMLTPGVVQELVRGYRLAKKAGLL